MGSCVVVSCSFKKKKIAALFDFEFQTFLLRTRTGCLIVVFKIRKPVLGSCKRKERKEKGKQANQKKEEV